MPGFLPALGAATAAVAGSLGAFSILVALRRPAWASHEHLALLVWSVPLGLLVLLLSLAVRRRVMNASVLARIAVALVAGVLSGVAWSYASYYLSGGWVMAFDAPVLFCWSAGASAGLIVAFLWPGAEQNSARAAA
jgi:hypothetical protein